MGLDRSKQLAVEALTDKLKAMIEARVAESDSYGSSRVSWHLRDELKSDPAWTGDKHTDADRNQGEKILASYLRTLAKMKADEAEVWKAIADMLKS